jgi:hypothetical protein
VQRGGWCARVLRACEVQFRWRGRSCEVEKGCGEKGGGGVFKGGLGLGEGLGLGHVGLIRRRRREAWPRWTRGGG